MKIKPLTTVPAVLYTGTGVYAHADENMTGKQDVTPTGTFENLYIFQAQIQPLAA